MKYKVNAKRANEKKNNLAFRIIPELIKSNARFGISGSFIKPNQKLEKKNAMEMLLTGDFINAEKAKEIGLINNIVPKEELSLEVNALAEKIASKSTMTVSTGKKAFYAQAEMDLSDAYKYTSKTMTDNLLKHDAKEGINSFIEKRSPKWQDK